MKSAAKAGYRFLASEEGPTAVEYAVMLALIIVVCVTILSRLGRTMSERGFDPVRDAVRGSS